MLLELTLLLGLILLNGALAMSELAIVSARPARLRARGDRGALIALRLAEDPGRFLSTVQIGITLVGVLSGAFSGATLGLRSAAALQDLGLGAALAQPLGVGSVVVIVTYLSLVVGELVPKQIALSNPEGVAARVAPAMALLAMVASPLVWVLVHSGKVILGLLGQNSDRKSRVSDEEIHMLIAEASDTLDQILDRFRTSGRTRLPLRDGGPDEIIGILHSRDLLNADPANFDPTAIMMPAPVIHDALPALEVVARLRASPEHMLLVFDEYGHFEGIVTAMDVLGGIAGGFDETKTDEPKVVTREDGSLLVAGWMPIREFLDRLSITLDDDGDFETVAGLVLHRLAELPREGQTVRLGDWRIEVIDMDGRRIDRLLVQNIAPRPVPVE